MIKKILRKIRNRLRRSREVVRPLPEWNGKIIYDLGLHVGQDTRYYLDLGFRVVSIDANPAMIENAREKFKNALEAGRLELVNAAIAEVSGTDLTFFVNNELSEWSSLDKDLGERQHGASEVTVTSKRFDDIVRQYGKAHYIKIDIEGADLLALSQIPMEMKPRYVSVENGGPELLDALLKLGYSRFQYVNQAHLRGAKLLSPSKEGCLTEYEFDFGSSGPFGLDLPDSWLSIEEARSFAQDLLTKRETMGSRFELEIGWFDLHATFDVANA